MAEDNAGRDHGAPESTEQMDATQEPQQDSGDPTVEEALAYGRRQQKRAEEDNQAQQKARQGEAQQGNAGRRLRGVMHSIWRVLISPFTIILNAARRIVGKITGEDLINKVKKAESDLEDLDTAYDRTDSKLAERVRDAQASMSKMHLDQARMADGMEAMGRGAQRGEGVAPAGGQEDALASAREGEQMADAPQDGPTAGANRSAGLPGGSSEPENAPKESVEGDYLGVGVALGGEKPQSAINTGIGVVSGEEHSQDMGRMDAFKAMVGQIPAGSVARDIASPERWDAWKKSGATPEQIRDSITEQRGDRWMKALDSIPDGGLKAMDKKAVGELSAAFLEMQCAANSKNMVWAAGKSGAAFDRQVAKQMLMSMAVVNHALKKGGVDEIKRAAEGDWTALTNQWENSSDDFVIKSLNGGGDLKKALDEWTQGTDASAQITVDLETEEPVPPSSKRSSNVISLPVTFTSDTEALPSSDSSNEAPENNGEDKTLENDAKDGPADEVKDDEFFPDSSPGAPGC